MSPLPEHLRMTPGQTLASERYYSTDFERAERSLLWPSVWTIAGHVRSLGRAGWLAHRSLGGRPALLVGQGDGAVLAFENTCRHRGARLCEKDGLQNLVTCPVHGWSWRLDGALRGVRDRRGFRSLPNDLSLLSIPCEVRHGLVWVAGSEDVVSLDAFLGPLDEALHRAALTDWVPVSDTSIALEANWKVSSDMHNEAYHLEALHPELRGSLDVSSIQMRSLGRHHQIDFSMTLGEQGPVHVTQYGIFPNAQLTIHPQRAMLLTHRPGRDVATCFFDEMNLVPPFDGWTAPARSERPADCAEVGAMAAADLLATQQLAAGLRDARHPLHLHEHEAGIEHMHRGIDAFLEGEWDVQHAT